MSNTYDPAARTADEWRQLAKESMAASGESWEHSDTDGFLSQMAHNANARMYRHLAKLADAGNVAEIPWVFEKIGDDWQPVGEWRWVDGNYGASVRIARDGGKGAFFNPSQAENPSVRQKRDEAKGFRFGVVRCEVVAKFGANLAIRDVRKDDAALTVVTSADYANN
ncbi:hypothetical protein SEA_FIRSTPLACEPFU_70 [Mycobacterium phage FirstPlacePfu]|uniref:Uncharacterized protein n=1 Tax=Mycobacterium phage FirstPlacePfu TaxID=2572533 RepID=A0A4D6TEC3_9CAUD|nr:hypothetical protein I5J46_gp70 [Mycobacterium phage FirstPlacePfu]QCG77732.1 hypothetical protein SEA_FIRSTPLACEPFU_70 [Mycobacterium phage FirstPlacePfu]